MRTKCHIQKCLNYIWKRTLVGAQSQLFQPYDTSTRYEESVNGIRMKETSRPACNALTFMKLCMLIHWMHNGCTSKPLQQLLPGHSLDPLLLLYMSQQPSCSVIQQVQYTLKPSWSSIVGVGNLICCFVL